MAPDRRTARPTVLARTRRERGESLLEVVIAILIIATVGVAGYTGLSVSLRSTSATRISAQGETLLRSTAEWIQSPDLAYLPRAGCSGVGTYSVPAIPTGTSGFAVTITGVSFWTGTSNTPVTTQTATFTSTCPTTAALDPGLQLVTIKVTGPDGRTDHITITKRQP